jgi:hypothetical protein
MKHLVILLAFATAACASAHIKTTQSAFIGPVPAPAQVVVTDFAITPDQVKLDRGVSAAFLRAANGQPASALQVQAAQATQAALTGTLAARLASYGLPVEHLPADAVPSPGTLLVQGQIASIDEGNRTRRTLIGLGAGKSSVMADAQLYYVADPARPQFLRSFSGTADSGHMPGAAETLGAGAAADRLATSGALTAATHGVGEARRTTDEANADTLAQALARQIGTYAASQGWIPASAVR